jgi:bifunctional ADP-heptose synthase (sugar kinase/adenylyltransferase)
MSKKYVFSKEYKNSLQQKPLRILLIGESCTDEYHYGTCARISPEAPVPVFDFISKSQKQGMAYNVKQNLESFGCIVDFKTNDSTELIKRRFIDIKSKQQLMREDIGKKVNPISFSFLSKNYDAIVISDYDKGLISNQFITYICNNFDGFKFVDTKKTDLSCFKNCIIKYNDTESINITNRGINCEEIETKGKNGAVWNGILYPAPEVELHDVTGAGDVFLSAFTCIYTSTLNMDESIQKSVILASKSVEHHGVYKLTEEDIDEICD